MSERTYRVWLTALLGLWMTLDPTNAFAFGTLRYQVPNGYRQGCIVCHNNPRGGSACSNSTIEPPRAAIPWTNIVVSGTSTPACPACTTTTDPGVAPCLNPFGLQFQIAMDAFGTGPERWAAVAMMDADGDGWTNGEELGDPAGTWVADAMPVPPPGVSPPVTNDPPFFTHPGDTDSTGTIDMCCITPNPDVDECAQGYDTCSDTGTA
ncbi:MAG: hypothetical protein K8H88_23225, partial [Sandaracinaceae bacterium]|nr:hypothetical protein [Sandaracinaceae bacterium]